ncbi:MAG TPA: glycosyltransferase family 4 protein [Rhodocyclaceae bacterium]
MKNILIEGWRGINHSFALVNQFQLAQLLDMPALNLRHADLPFLNPAWNRTDNNPGFAADLQARIDAIPAPGDEEFDTAYSIGWPARCSQSHCKKAITFFVTEFGVSVSDFAEGGRDIGRYTRDQNVFAVPSTWAKRKLVEFGFPAEKVHVVPHGVDPAAFAPPIPEQRTQLRTQLGVKPEEFMFLNLGAMTWNKGIDILVRAFAVIRQRHPHVKLILKDQKKLYGVGAESALQQLMSQSPEVITDDVRNAMVLVTSTMTTPLLNLLYGSADAYVSPYRAEGFNLPVIESIAAGTRVIVTAGGATDDFCNSGVAMKVESTAVDNHTLGIKPPGHHLEPRLDSVIAQMEAAVTGQGPSAESFAAGRELLLANYSWQACTRRLAELF